MKVFVCNVIQQIDDSISSIIVASKPAVCQVPAVIVAEVAVRPDLTVTRGAKPFHHKTEVSALLVPILVDLSKIVNNAEAVTRLRGRHCRRWRGLR